MRAPIMTIAVALITIQASVSCASPPQREMPFGDFSWMHGVNYTPSYAATDVETWLKYDPAVIDRELALAKRIGLNSVRVFLQSLVYEHAPEEFLKNFADFVATADRHGLKVMPILFDSCFGVSPSLESRHMWVANPGPDRMSEADFAALDGYIRAVVMPYVGDQRIALWDVMNEPSVTVLLLTEKGKAQIWAFVRHYGELVRKLDRTHAITVGVASSDNSQVVDLVDVLSCHSYAPTREKFRQALAATRRQAQEGGKPWIISECCAPGWGSPYEMVFPELREFGVGHTAWELVIGKNQFAPISGLFYPDGTVRRLSSIKAVVGGPIAGLAEKPDANGMPVARERVGRLAEYVQFMSRNEVTESTWRERNTAVAALIVHGVYNPDAADVLKRLQHARATHLAGRRATAYREVALLLRRAADVLTKREKVRQEAEKKAVEAVFPGKTWSKRTPAEVGLDAAKLREFSRFVGGRGCVVRHGYLVYSWGDVSRRADVASACKPFYSHFLFTAVENGKIPSLDEKAVRWEPRLNEINEKLGSKDANVTWRHFANQTSCYQLAEKPGTAYAYNDWQMALFWDTLFLKVYGANRDNVDQRVFRALLTEPLQCQDNPTMMAFGTKNRPGRVGISVRDFARFGLLYLRRGSWGGKQLIGREHAMTAVSSPLPNSIPRAGRKAAEMIPGQRTIGSGSRPDNQTDHFGSYSWLWWVNGVDRTQTRFWPDAPHDTYGAFGHGGPRAMWVIPSLDIVVSYNDARLDGWHSGENSPTNQAMKRLVAAVDHR